MPPTVPTEPMPPSRRQTLSTRTLLICAAFGAVQALMVISLSPITPGIAALAPPVYALIAGFHSIMPFTARLMLGSFGTASLTGFFAGVIAGSFSVVGFLVIVPLTVGGLVFDTGLWALGRWRPRVARIAAAALAGVGLFAVSLPVFSPEHLTVTMVALTLLARVVSEIGAVLVAGLLAHRLTTSGIQGHPRRRRVD
ncbi:hypothetical protein [Agromyces ramosus]|uniref:Energy-coupling factor transport system substrate-specific component n=1 Tax=Agromyces ramosus TaxID=33879 RepID=A0ABU0R8R6_9MICO|nr:hypothetical protein [Agromyces ramosus]MDQ0894177.1 hypothetical protein [Agromyces ramosus]